MGTAGAACLSADQLHIIMLLIYWEGKAERLPTSTLAIFISVAILSQLGSAVCDASTRVTHHFMKYGDCWVFFIDDVFYSTMCGLCSPHRTLLSIWKLLFLLQKPENGDTSKHAFLNENHIKINIKILMEWIMNKAELFAKGNLINQTIKINCMWRWKRIEKYHCNAPAFSLPFDFTSKMQSYTVASFGSRFVNMQHRAKSVVIRECCDLHSNIYNSPLCDQQLIKAAPLKHC